MYTVPKPRSGSEQGQEQPATTSSETAPSGPQAIPSLTASPVKKKTSDGFFADGVFRTVVTLCAVALVAIVGLIFYELVLKSQMSLSKFGFLFLVRRIWDPVADDFGALPFVYGTLVSSLVALIIAVPLSLGTALFLTELCPRRLRPILSLLVELLAAIPSVIYGLWGLFVMVPFLRDHIEPALEQSLGWTGFFSGPILGRDMLAAGTIHSGLGPRVRRNHGRDHDHRKRPADCQVFARPRLHPRQRDQQRVQ
jgi:phosphate transport system permease protein